jgi:hypothetical protein
MATPFETDHREQVFSSNSLPANLSKSFCEVVPRPILTPIGDQIQRPRSFIPSSRLTSPKVTLRSKKMKSFSDAVQEAAESKLDLKFNIS